MPEKQYTRYLTVQKAKKMIRGFNGKPLLIHGPALEQALVDIRAQVGKAMQMPPEAEAPLPEGEARQRSLSETPVSTSGSVIAVISVQGILTNHYDSFLDWYVGATSYDDIRAAFRMAMADPNVIAVVFSIDSPGGYVAGLYDLVDDIYGARGTKPIYAIVNEEAYSAAYALASAADKIFLPRTGGIGSIGVIAVHVDQSGWDEQMGEKYTAVYAGSHKNDFTPHEPLSGEAKQLLQKSVDETYALFVATVARNRGMSEQAVRDTEAMFFEGKKAVAIGLADEVLSCEQAMDVILAKSAKQGGNKSMKFWDSLCAFFRGLTTEDLSDQQNKELAKKLKAAVSSVPADEVSAVFAELGFVPRPADGAAAGQAQIDAACKSAVDAHKDETVEVLEICALGKTDLAAATAIVKEGLKPDAARQRVLNQKAEETGRHPVRSSVDPLSAGEVSPFVADARRRAEAAKPRK